MDSTLVALEAELERLRRGMRISLREAAVHAHPDLDPTGYNCLLTIRELTANGAVPRLGDVAAATTLHKSSASRAVAALESLKFVERLADPHDARAVRLRLTESGEDALQRTYLRWREMLIQQTHDWTKADLQQLVHLLSRLSR